MINKEMLFGTGAAAVFVIIGCVMCYFGIYVYAEADALKSTGLVTKGTILRFERRGFSSRDKDKLLIPIIQFQTADGAEITFDGAIDNRSLIQNMHDRGDTVEVVYDPKHPANAKINTFADFWFAPLLLLVIGAAFIFFPPFTVWKYYKETITPGNIP